MKRMFTRDVTFLSHGFTPAPVYRALLEEEEEGLKKEGIRYNSGYKLGIMIETPAAALSADQLANAVTGALERLHAVGAPDALLARLTSAQYQLAALPVSYRGLADVAANRVFLSATAAG